MNIDNPFETFEKSAFRLEALPQYIVENEKHEFSSFKSLGRVPVNPNPEWANLVKTNIKSGKSMKRLRLLSDELTLYEQFELQSYPGIQYGEEIRINARSKYKDTYLYDFWFFDDEYIARMNYEDDGTFISFEVKKATKEEKANFRSWLDVFNRSSLLE